MGTGVNLRAKLAAFSWRDPDKIVDHPREPWPSSGCESIFSSCDYGAMKGLTHQGNEQDDLSYGLYNLAKRFNDHEAAADLVDALASQEVLEELDRRNAHAITSGMETLVVYPSPSYPDSDVAKSEYELVTNAIPSAYARLVADSLGIDVDSQIKQKARVGRTKLKKMQRLLWQPSFIGDVRSGAGYFIVEDMVTLGGTIASLASYIIANGGHVVGVTSLATKGGLTLPLALLENTRAELIDEYGLGFSAFWGRAVGHVGDRLTDGEASWLLEWIRKPENGEGFARGSARLQRLRDRLFRVCEKGE